ncbi:DUF3558 domain-containing protein [Nocardia sp. SSK8]|uniref:DUF3558 domain-containing protein n=1 Tax=Nocardia sp. SSK8 TaxID=3120154 RepID=UPI00300A3CFD
MNRGAVVRTLVVGAAISSLVGGCSSGSDGETQPSTSAAATTPESVLPTGFDGCDLPQSVIDTEELKNPKKDDGWTTGANKWLGCRWVQSGGYGAAITVSTITIQQVRENSEVTVGEELTIDGRQAITHYKPAQADKWCDINVEMKNGSMEISIGNQPNREKSGHRHPCDIAKDLANMLAPTINSAS